jgi:hypothetical protein
MQAAPSRVAKENSKVKRRSKSASSEQRCVCMYVCIMYVLLSDMGAAAAMYVASGGARARRAPTHPRTNPETLSAVAGSGLSLLSRSLSSFLSFALSLSRPRFRSLDPSLPPSHELTLKL